MNLYFAPGACSLADHIALHEAGLTFNRVKVDLKSHRTEDGRDIWEMHFKGREDNLDLLDPKLDESQMQEVSQQLGQILNEEL